MAEKLRKILEDLVEGITAGYKERFDFETLPEENYDYAIIEIKSLLKSKLPKEQPRYVEYNEYNKAYRKGYNQALTEIEKTVEEL